MCERIFFPILVAMRKSLAIFFLFIIMLNTAGYYLVFEGWKWRNSITWSFDENSSASQEMIVKVPITMPYAMHEKDWEKSDGQFEYKGEVYRIVKQKVTPDAVYIACVKDQESSRLNEQLEDFAKTFSDKPGDAKQSAKAFPRFMKEYISDAVSIKSSIVGWSLESTFVLAPQSIVSSFSASIIHPPERA